MGEVRYKLVRLHSSQTQVFVFLNYNSALETKQRHGLPST
jgi:hypothetical protein